MMFFLSWVWAQVFPPGADSQHLSGGPGRRQTGVFLHVKQVADERHSPEQHEPHQIATGDETVLLDLRDLFFWITHLSIHIHQVHLRKRRSEERRVGKECRSRWS